MLRPPAYACLKAAPPARSREVKELGSNKNSAASALNLAFMAGYLRCKK